MIVSNPNSLFHPQNLQHNMEKVLYTYTSISHDNLSPNIVDYDMYAPVQHMPISIRNLPIIDNIQTRLDPEDGYMQCLSFLESL